jgi:hypothetical protein
MAIEFNKDDISFRVTDTLHQLVDRLNTFEERMVENRKLVDSNLNDLVFMVSRDSGQYTADSDLAIVSDHDIMIQCPDNFRVESGTVQMVSDGLTELGGTGAMLLSSDEDNGNVVLRSNGSTYGVFRKNSNHLEILSGLGQAVIFRTGDAKFPGTITMPSAGDGSPYTNDKTVHGAINELHEELEVITTEELLRITTLEGQVVDINNNIDTLDTRSTSNVNRISNLEAIHIATRLNTIESQIVQINNRLNILEL